MSFLTSPELLMQTPVLIFIGMMMTFAGVMIYLSITDTRHDN